MRITKTGEKIKRKNKRNPLNMISDTEILDWIFKNCSVSYDSLDVYDRETALDVMDDMYREQLASYEDEEPYEYE